MIFFRPQMTLMRLIYADFILIIMCKQKKSVKTSRISVICGLKKSIFFQRVEES